MKNYRKLLTHIYRRHSIVMLVVWLVVGFYIDRVKGALISGLMYLVVAPLLIYLFEIAMKYVRGKK